MFELYGNKRGFGNRTGSGGGNGPSPLLGLSTPILFEGDSNTAWSYGATGDNWAKLALSFAGGRYYIPVGGDFATAGATISGTPNGLVARQSQTVAKITQMVALKGACIMWFQIGTNGGIAGTDIPALRNLVNAWKAAGARVYCNTMPIFQTTQDPATYGGRLNRAIKGIDDGDGIIPVDGFVDVNDPAAVPNGITPIGGTHYSDISRLEVAQAVAAQLLTLINAASVYSEAGWTIDSMSGTSGTLGTGCTGQVPTSFNLSRTNGTGTAVASVLASGISGLRSTRLVLTGGASGDTTFRLSKSDSLSIAVGDVVDGLVTFVLEATTDPSPAAKADVADGSYPASSPAALFPDRWATPRVWRMYPGNAAASASSISKGVTIRVAANTAVTVEISGFAHRIREGSATVAPVNTVAPVMNAVTVGGTPSCSNGTWTGTPTPSYTQQFYLYDGVDFNPIASNYVFQAGDVGRQVKCFVTATNSGGNATVESNTVTVSAASTFAVFDSTYNTTITYSNGNKTLQNVTGVVTRATILNSNKDLSGVDDYYFEVNIAGGNISRVGVCSSPASGSIGQNGSTGTVNGVNSCYLVATGTMNYSSADGATGTTIALGATFGDGSTVRFAIKAARQWLTGTPYEVGKLVFNGTRVYRCSAAGTSGATAPTGTGTVSDGGATWVYVGEYSGFKRMLWVKKHGGTFNWNGTVGADPATGVGGLPAGGLADTISAFVVMPSNTGVTATLATNPADMVGGVPTGFVPWTT